MTNSKQQIEQKIPSDPCPGCRKRDEVITRLEELVNVFQQQLNILANNENSDVIKYIGLRNLHIDLRKEIEQLKNQL